MERASYGLRVHRKRGHTENNFNTGRTPWRFLVYGNCISCALKEDGERDWFFCRQGIYMYTCSAGQGNQWGTSLNDFLLIWSECKNSDHPRNSERCRWHVPGAEPSRVIPLLVVSVIVVRVYSGDTEKRKIIKWRSGYFRVKARRSRLRLRAQIDGEGERVVENWLNLFLLRLKFGQRSCLSRMGFNTLFKCSFLRCRGCYGPSEPSCV